MTLKNKAIALLMGVSVVLSFSACSTPIHPVGSVLTTKQSFLMGKRIPTKVFSLEDVIRYYVDFTWDDVTGPAGDHQIIWNWYKADVLVSTGTKERVYFKRAPHGIFTMRPASALGVGKFRIDVLVDGKVMSSVDFEIR